MDEKNNISINTESVGSTLSSSSNSSSLSKEMESSTQNQPLSDCHACGCNTPFVLVSSPPKTGAATMRSALLTMGFGPTMHNVELQQRDTNFVYAWREALKNPGAVDWVNFISDYDSGCGEPLHDVAPEVIKAFGRAKKTNCNNRSNLNSEGCRKCSGSGKRLKLVIMTSETNEWNTSISQGDLDVFSESNSGYKRLKFLSKLVPGRKQRLLLDVLNRCTSSSKTKYHQEYITQHRLELQRIARDAGIDERDILVYDIKQGWDPLCEFLQVKQKPLYDFPGLHTITIGDESEDYGKIRKKLMTKVVVWSFLWLFVIGAAIALIASFGALHNKI